MSLRMLEVHVPAELGERAEETLRSTNAEQVWHEREHGALCVVRAVLDADRTGGAMDLLYEAFGHVPELRVLVFPLDATLPRRKPAVDAGKKEQRPRSPNVVSREEVYAKIKDASELSATYLAMVCLSTVVAAIGLAKDNVAAVIGAMVVAPLLGPNMGLALGLSLADRDLARSAIASSLAGLVLAFFTALLLGVGLQVSPEIPAIASRTHVDLADILLALAAGCAGTLAYTTGAPTYLIGVMVAVALLPPAVVSGLLVGEGHPYEALGAGLLVLANATAVNLAAIVTFALKGLRPRRWWRAEKAKKNVRLAIAIGLGLLLLLGIAIVISRSLPDSP